MQLQRDVWNTYRIAEDVEPKQRRIVKTVQRYVHNTSFSATGECADAERAVLYSIYVRRKLRLGDNNIFIVLPRTMVYNVYV